MAAEHPAPTPPPWEPPFAGSEQAHLLGALDRQRATFLWKADGLDDAQLGVPVVASTMTLGGLLLHLAAVEVLCSTWRLTGAPPRGPWDPRTWDEPGGRTATFDTGGRPAAELYEIYDGAVASSRSSFAAALER